MSCLIIKNDGIGDLVLSSGLISKISELFGGSVDLVTCAQNKEIAEDIAGIQNIYYVSRDGLRFHKMLKDLNILKPIINNKDLEIIKILKKKKYDVAICLRRYIRESSLIIMKNVIASKKYCAWQYPTNTHDKNAIEYSKGWIHHSGDLKVIHELTYYKNFVEKIFNSSIDVKPVLNSSKNITTESEEKKIGLCVGGTISKWPLSNWIELVKYLEINNWDIYLFGGKDVYKDSKLLENYSKKCFNLVGSISLTESLEYLKKISFFVGNDTGFTHYANLIVPRSLIILGGGTFGRFFPWPDTTNQYILYHALDCFDCNWKCKFSNKKCINKIQPCDVINYIEDIINSKDTKKNSKSKYIAN